MLPALLEPSSGLSRFEVCMPCGLALGISRCRGAAQQSLCAQVLIDIRPVDAEASAAKLSVLEAFRAGIQKLWTLSQRNHNCPSNNSTISVSSVKRTSFNRSPGLGSETPIPFLQKHVFFSFMLRWMQRNSNGLKPRFRTKLEHAVLVDDLLRRDLHDVPEFRNSPIFESKDVNDCDVRFTRRTQES